MHQVTPVANADGTVVDFTVSNHRELHHGLVDPTGADYREHNDGSIHHVMEDVTLEESDGGFDFDTYAQALRDVYPQMNGMLQYAATNMPPEFSIEFNQAVQNQDLDSIGQYLHQLAERYESETGNVILQQEDQEQEDNPDELDPNQAELQEWYADNITDEFIDETLDTLVSNDLTEDHYYVMEEALGSVAEGSAESAILEVGMAVAQGQMDMTSAINHIVDQYGEAQAAAAYIQLSHLLNN